MWPFGVSEKRVRFLVTDAVTSEARFILRKHEQNEHHWYDERCPICGKRLLKRKRTVVETPGQLSEMSRAIARATASLSGKPYRGDDETLTFACGTKRIRKDGKVRVVAKCLEVGK
jgi:hypothetical protein